MKLVDLLSQINGLQIIKPKQPTKGKPLLQLLEREFIKAECKLHNLISYSQLHYVNGAFLPQNKYCIIKHNIEAFARETD